MNKFIRRLNLHDSKNQSSLIFVNVFVSLFFMNSDDNMKVVLYAC